MRELGQVQSGASGLVVQAVAEKKRRSQVGDTITGLSEGFRIESCLGQGDVTRR